MFVWQSSWWEGGLYERTHTPNRTTVPQRYGTLSSRRKIQHVLNMYTFIQRNIWKVQQEPWSEVLTLFHWSESRDGLWLFCVLVKKISQQHAEKRPIGRMEYQHGLMILYPRYASFMPFVASVKWMKCKCDVSKDCPYLKLIPVPHSPWCLEVRKSATMETLTSPAQAWPGRWNQPADGSLA